MKVIRAKSAGFCFGVSLALRRLDMEIERREALQEQCPWRIITLGPIIHNPLVMDAYAAKGVLCCDDTSLIKQGDRVIIRAHGVPQELEQELVATGAIIVDATCPKVKKAQLAIAGKAGKGKTLLLFGEKDHPEVRGLVSYAHNEAIVFSSLEELEALPLDASTDYYLAAQTTQDKEIFEMAKSVLEQRLGKKPVALSTICNATRKRQEEAIAVAKQVDAMVVVGGLNSGNTRRLADVAMAQGIPAYHVEKVEDLPAEVGLGCTSIGLTAGASTPDDHICEMQAVLSFMKGAEEK